MKALNLVRRRTLLGLLKGDQFSSGGGGGGRIHWAAFSTSVPAPETEKDAEAATPTQEGGGKMDPFGIAELDEPNRSKLVQGFLGESESQDGKAGNLKKYEEWLKARNKINLREKMGSGDEQVRTSAFGTVRLDKDNLVEEDGQYDDPQEYQEKLLMMKNRRKFKKVEGQDQPEQERRSRSESGGGSGSVLAVDLLRQLKQAEREKEHKIVERPTAPKRVRRSKDEEEVEQFSELYGSIEKPATNIPKIYTLPVYNNLAHADVWNILKSTVVFENEYVLAINKPAGIPMHSPAVDCRHYIIQFLDKFAKLSKVERMFPLHRLDKETTGALIFAKDERIAKFLKEKFALRQVEKKYLAIVKGCPRAEEATIKIPVGEAKVGGTDKYRSTLKPDLRGYNIPSRQDNCREAVTHYRVLRSTKDSAFLEVRIETGVKHQIRIHLGLGLGCPVIGDHKYSHRDRMAPQRLHPHLCHVLKVRQSKVRELPLHLHCNAIEFTLPDGATENAEPVYVHAKVPDFFKNTLRAFRLQ